MINSKGGTIVVVENMSEISTPRGNAEIQGSFGPFSNPSCIWAPDIFVFMIVEK